MCVLYNNSITTGHELFNTNICTPEAGAGVWVIHVVIGFGVAVAVAGYCLLVGDLGWWGITGHAR
jgi:hypothetical protein